MTELSIGASGVFGYIAAKHVAASSTNAVLTRRNDLEPTSGVQRLARRTPEPTCPITWRYAIFSIGGAT